MSFTGFPPETVAFLTDLRANNSKQWFDAHRDDYEAYYLEPAKAFVETAGEAARAFSPNVEYEPKINASIRRINRDVRFSADKRPYKDHLDIGLWEGDKKAYASGYYVRITPDGVGVGAGAHGFDKEQLSVFREALLDSKKRARLLTAVAAADKAGYPVHGEHYKRLPRGFEDAPEEAHDLLRFAALWTGEDEPHPKSMSSKAFVGWVARRWEKLDPIHRWLVDNLQ